MIEQETKKLGVYTLFYGFKLSPKDENYWTNENKKQSIITCPVCMFDYTKVDCAYKEDGETYSVWDGRGGKTTIEMKCEDGHEFSLIFGTHKGKTFSWVEIKE